MIARFVLAIAALVSARGALAQDRVETDTATTVQVSGYGEIRLAPTKAAASFSVESRAQTAAAASAANGAVVRRLVDALNGIRQATDSVLVVGVAVRPNQNYQTGELRGYVASATVRATISDLERVGRVLDVALASGATSLSGVEFRADSTDAARRTALAIAFSEARANADAIARAAGTGLGPLLRVTTTGEQRPQPYMMQAARLEAISVTGGVPITPGDIVVSANLTATWRLRGR